MSKKYFSLLLVLSITLFSMAGCNTSTTSTGNTSSAEASDPAQTGDTITPDATAVFSTSESAITYPLSDGSAVVTMWTDFITAFTPYFSSFNELPTLETIKEKTGIQYKFIEVTTDSASTQFNLMIASGDWPDVLAVQDYYVGGVAAAKADDVIYDLTDLLPTNAPDYWAALMDTNQNTIDSITTNGKHLQMVSLTNESVSDGGNVTRGDWLEEMGMEVPTTFDEFNDMLYAIKNKYNTDYTYYLKTTGQIYSAGTYFGTGLFSLLNATNVACYIDEGKVVSSATSDGFRKYIEWLAQLYEDGIINKEFYAGDLQQGTTNTYIGSGRIGVWNAFADSLNNYAQYSDDEDLTVIPIPNIPNAEGYYDFASEPVFANTKGFSITTACEDPSLVLKFFNWFYTKEGIHLANYGIEGQATTTDADGNIEWTELVTDNPQGMDMMMAMQYYTFSKAPELQDATKLWSTYPDNVLEAINMWSDDSKNKYDHAYPAGAALSSEETASIATTMTDVISYASEALTKLVTGAEEINDETWTQYVDTCKSSGLDEVISVYQKAYDNYSAG